jgi:hypothetical protein
MEKAGVESTKSQAVVGKCSIIVKVKSQARFRNLAKIEAAQEIQGRR